MFIAGYPVPGPDVLELARLVNDPDLAERLESAYGRQVRVFALDIPEREAMIWALNDPPTKALAELRAVLSRSTSAASETGSSSGTPLASGSVTGGRLTALLVGLGVWGLSLAVFLADSLTPAWEMSG